MVDTYYIKLFRTGKVWRHYLILMSRDLLILVAETMAFFKKPDYFKPIENGYLKIHPVYFNDFNVLFKAARHWKIDFLQFKLFLIEDYSFAW